MRLDIECLNRKLFETRNKAQNEIKAGNVYVNNKKTTQSSLEINETDIITIKGNSLKYVSKGGLKLEKILKKAKINLNDKIMIDVGASTGGFTDCALNYGIKKVYTIDVGTNQLHSSLLQNPKIVCYENTDFKDIECEKILDANIATVDVSFISSIKMIPKFKELPALNEILLLIKPQFECGKEFADKYKGVITNRDIHINILNKLLNEYKKNGIFCQYLTYSPIKGAKGNIEYMGYFNKENLNKEIEINEITKMAFDELNKDKKVFYKHIKPKKED